MFYDALKGDHGLPHDPVNALVAPRPIGWISTMNADGVLNLAPYSYFNLMASHPPVVAFASATVKDTQRNIEATGEFVCNIAGADVMDALNQSSANLPPEGDEFAFTGLETAPSTLVKPPRVKQAKAALECRYVQTVPLPSGSDRPHIFSMVIGLVVGVFIDDGVIKEGLVDVTLVRPLSRLGYMDYAITENVFAMARPEV